MKYLKQFAVILALSFVGELLYLLIPLPIPASIYGIILLFVGLETRLIPLDAVRETGLFLVEIMPILFVPALVGLLESWDIIKGAWLPYIAVTVITTAVVMIISGHVTQLIIRSRKDATVHE